MGEPPYHLDIEELQESDDGCLSAASFRDRPWVGIHFDCCSVYTRVYRNRDGTAYRGSCPRCTATVTLRVGSGGTNARFFVAD